MQPQAMSNLTLNSLNAVAVETEQSRNGGVTQIRLGLVDHESNFCPIPSQNVGVHKPSKLRRLYPMKKDVIEIRLPSCSGVLSIPLEQKPKGGN